ncbi:MAG: hypothetical protein ACOCQD_00980 [archaeon]
MPSKTKKQRDFMRAAAHNLKFARRAGIDQEVAKKYYKEDKKVDRKKGKKS